MVDIQYENLPKVVEIRMIDLWNRESPGYQDGMEILASIPCIDGFILVVRDGKKDHEKAKITDIGRGE